MSNNEIFTIHVSPYVTLQGTDDDLIGWGRPRTFRFVNRRTGEVDYTPDPDRFLDNRNPFDWELDT